MNRVTKLVAIATATAAGTFGGHWVGDTLHGPSLAKQQQEIDACAKQLGNTAVFSATLPKDCYGFAFEQDSQTKEWYIPSADAVERLNRPSDTSKVDAFDERVLTTAGAIFSFLVSIETVSIIGRILEDKKRRIRPTTEASV